MSRQVLQGNVYGTVTAAPHGADYVWVRPDGRERDSVWALDGILVRAIRTPKQREAS